MREGRPVDTWAEWCRRDRVTTRHSGRPGSGAEGMGRLEPRRTGEDETEPDSGDAVTSCGGAETGAEDGPDGADGVGST